MKYSYTSKKVNAELGVSGGDTPTPTPSSGGKVVDYTNVLETLFNSFDWVENDGFEFTTSEDCYVIGALYYYTPYNADTATIDNVGQVLIDGELITIFRQASTSVGTTNQFNIFVPNGSKIQFINPVVGSAHQFRIKGIIKAYGMKEVV